MKERGSATILVLAVTAVLAACLVGVAAVGVAYAARMQAATAADAAALAAAVASYPGTGRSAGPGAEAARAAASNGGILVACVCPVDPSASVRTVTVRTAVPVDLPLFGRVQILGAARAEFDPMAWLGR